MIPGGWIGQRKAANTQHHPGLVKDTMEEKVMLFLVDGIGRERPAITNKIMALLMAPPPSPHHTGI